jgi:hypothetical protein
MADARDDAYAALGRLFQPTAGNALSEEPSLIRETARKLDAWAEEVERRALAWAWPFFKQQYGDNEEMQ